ncbi:TAP42-like family protein [Spironucleus salmonicida]|uniref:TAP42-like family protein n=1 Tax=Spironucleus salmonicida TaxID=348837 RepID=V6LDZ5_9EUKA|nr:TAP42-like family protein [Spironucleus salmonicida]|eukprot:EST42503.1 TAP42-like family protein [Spironucleus salmonicida]
MEQYLLIVAVQRQLKQSSPEERLTLIPALLAQCNELHAYSISNQMLSKNEEFDELNEDQLACLLSNFLIAKAHSDFYTARDTRLQSVQLALESMRAYVDLLLLLDLYSSDQIKLLANELDPSRARDVKRNLILEEEKYRKEADNALNTILSGNLGEELAAMRSCVHHAKFEAIREIRFLEEELEMLEFERNNPREAENALKERELFLLQNASKPIQMVQMDENLVSSIQKKGKFVPLDTVELMKLEQEKAATKKQITGNDVNAVIQKQCNQDVSQSINWGTVDLAYGGGNPDVDCYYDKEYKIVRTDTFYPGQEDPEPEMDWKRYTEKDMLEEGRGDEEDYDPAKIQETRDWDDWKDQHPTGQGNKRRMV